MAKAAGKEVTSTIARDRHAVILLLEFLENTEIGCRREAAKIEAKWQQRRDQEREDQLRKV